MSSPSHPDSVPPHAGRALGIPALASQASTSELPRRVISEFPTALSRPCVIVGAGPTGIHVARELLHRSSDLKVVLYSAEPWEPYNRVLLSELLAGELDWPAIVNPAPFVESGRLELRINTAVLSIDRIGQVIVDSAGNRVPYSRLVLATGSSAFVPELERVSLLGVYVYRDVNHTQTLMTNAVQSRCTVVLGGGTLGVEVARALKTQNPEARIIVVHRAEQLMNRELDADAARILEQHILQAGIELRLRETITDIEGEREISGVVLAGGERIACDTLVLCTGIERNTRLARGAGLSVAQGIKVDDRMCTSDPRIFAVGECAEHRGEVYGQVAPGIAQAKVAAINLTGGSATYAGSDHYLRLKVVQVPVYSIRRGQRDGESQRAVTYTSKDGSSLRRLVVQNRKLVGATSIGDWDESEAVHQALVDGTPVGWWQLRHFRREGRLWPEKAARESRACPDSVMVCACMGVTYGMVRHAVAEGHTTLDRLRERTGASQACGSCRSTLARIVGASLAPPPARKGWALAYAGIALTVVALSSLVFPPLRDGRPWLERGWADTLLFDAGVREVTGYVALGLVLSGSALALRKRVRRFTFGDYDSWQTVHALIGGAAAAAVVVHTGFELGARFNAVFLLVFAALLASGAFVGALTPAHAQSPLARGFRAAHQLLVWLIPPLLAVHILTVYYF
jgi:nitrite reductase (NADH) large subunit